MKTIPDLILAIAQPAPGSSRVSVAMLLIAIHMIYGGEYK